VEGYQQKDMERPEVKVEFQLAEKEYLAATRLLLLNSREILARLIIFCVLILAGAVILNLIVVEFFPLWATIAFVLLFEISLLYNIIINGPRRYFRGDLKFRDKYELTFSDEGVLLKTPQIDSKLAWSLYTRVIEGRDMYLLVYGKETRMMTMVPKRSFRNSDEENRFRQLVSRHISDASGLKKVSTEVTEYTPNSLTPPDWR
jgi:hypothetical protein